MQTFITHRGVVYAWQCDHFGHMNNVWYAAKFDEAGWNTLLQIGITPSYLRDNHRGMVSVEHVTNFKHELLAGDIVEIRTQLVEVRDKVVRFTHTMYNAETGVEAATLALVAVHTDTTARKSCPFPPTLRATIERLGGLLAAA